MNFFEFFKPAPHLEEIKNTEEIKKKYRYWRIRTFYSMYLGYAFFYFSRKSFTFAMPGMIQDLGMDKAQLGMLGSILSITYGLSKFVSGVMSDRSNPRFFMSMGLIMTGILNIFFGFSSTLVLFALIWGLNGWFQGWGWPPCAKLLTHWYSQKERGRWWSLWNTSHNVGGALIPIIVSFITVTFGWRYGMYLPGVACIFTGLILMNRLRDTPQSLALPPIEKYREDKLELAASDEEKVSLSVKEILVKYVLKNPYIWLLLASYFFVYVIRQAMNDWTVLFLMESKGYGIVEAGMTVFWFEVGGFLGSIAAGWASDRIFGGKRGPVNLIFTLFVLVVMYCLWRIPGGIILDSFFMLLIGFFIFGPQMLIGVAAAELSHKKAAGTATGFIGFFAYLGAAVAGWPLGEVAKRWGWEGFFMILFLSAIVASVFLIPLWNARFNPKYAEEKQRI